MQNKDKAKGQLVDELARVHQPIVKLEVLEAERKLVEAVRYERDELVRILEAMGDGVCIINQQHDIEYLNLGLETQFGSPEGQKCYEYFHSRQESCPWCRNVDVFTGKTVRWEWYSPKNHKTYDLLDTPFRQKDGSIAKLEIFREITVPHDAIGTNSMLNWPIFRGES